MEISGIRSTFPFLFSGTEKESGVKLENGDKIDIHSPQILSDEDAEKVISETVNIIEQDPALALSVHSGLSENRVFALLGA